jgi:hypothetical protein
MDVERDVTIIMTTFGCLDFTKASLWAIRRFHPNLRIILADGGSGSADIREMQELGEVIVGFDKTSEEMCNIAAALVETPYVLFMDNDCKVIAKEALPLLVDVLEKHPLCACTGAYAVKVLDWQKMIALTGTVFNAQMEVDATARYFQLHKTKAFKRVGGFPTKEWFYENVPFDPKAVKQGCQGDLSISKHYPDIGFMTFCPAATVPVIHWGMAKVVAQSGEQADIARDVENFYWKNAKHTRMDPRPLNDWADVARHMMSDDIREAQRTGKPIVAWGENRFGIDSYSSYSKEHQS